MIQWKNLSRELETFFFLKNQMETLELKRWTKLIGFNGRSQTGEPEHSSED